MSDLPRPVTAVDEYLAAIHGVLVDICDRLSAAPQEFHVVPPGQVELREPATGQSKTVGGRARKRPDAAPQRPARTAKSPAKSTPRPRKETGDG